MLDRLSTLRRIKRGFLAGLLAIQALGGAAVTLAHARDVAPSRPALEAGHDGRCAILHDEVRCALCQYASTRVVTQNVMLLPAMPLARRPAPTSQDPVAAASTVRRTALARAPPTPLS